MARLSFAISLLLGLASAQTLGKSKEVHPKLQTWKCTNRGGCTKQNSAIVLDELAHPVHQLKAPSLDCGSWGNPPNVTVCPDEKTCAKNCVVEGISDYSKYGISTKGGSVTLHQLLADGTNVSPRAYLLNQKGDKYEMLKLTGNEISFDADVSKLPCGMNGALYMAEMEADGGRSKLNPGGASYGSGYCDAQCYTLPFINGVVRHISILHTCLCIY
jgi:cellulase